MPAAPTPPGAGQVLTLIRAGAADTRSAVGRATGLSRTAVSARLAALVASGLVVEDAEGASTGGRPAGRLRFDEKAGLVAAAAIGRSRTQLAVCDLAGTVLTGEDLDQEVGVDPDRLMPRVAQCLRDLVDRLGRPVGDVRGIGVSIPGTVDRGRGASLDSPIMTGWDGVPLAPYLEGLGGAPVLVDNDSFVLALSERSGTLTRFRDLLVVKASTGLGAGVVADGELRRGASGAAGEIGHTKVESAAGLPCRCGDTGCVEAVAGGWALVQAMQAEGQPVGHVRDVVARAADGDPRARQLIRDSGRRVGEVIAGAVNLLNPEAVVIGGDMAGAYDTFVAGLRESVYARASALATRELLIVPATHGEQAGVVGCAALALEEVLSVSAVDALVRRTP